VAAATLPMDAETMSQLKKSVSRIWMHNAADLYLFQGYTPNNVEALFDWLALNETDWEFCIGEFVFLIRKQNCAIPATMKDFALNSADEVSRYYCAPENKALIKEAFRQN